MDNQNRNSEASEQSYIVTNPNTPDSIIEAYASLSDNVRFILAPTNGKIIGITSNANEEGKSTVAVNLAITLAQNSSKVSLVDADVRLPVIHKKLKLRNIKGFSNFISGFESLSDVLKRDVIPCLDVITSGLVVPNASDLLKSNNVKIFFEKIREYYDYIIVDCPTIQPNKELALFSESIDGVLISTKDNSTSVNNLKAVKASLQDAKINILGFVVTEKIFNKTNEHVVGDETEIENV